MERDNCGCGCTGMDKAPEKDAEGAKKADAKPAESKEKRESK